MNLLEMAAQKVRYVPETGEFLRPDGSDATHAYVKGYRGISVGGTKVLAHRVAWHVMRGGVPDVIDHINRNKADNRWANLRAATTSDNLCNRGAQSNNTSGVPGVALDRHGRKWQAYIKKNGKRVHLGIFEKFEDAVMARKAAERRVFGEFAPA